MFFQSTQELFTVIVHRRNHCVRTLIHKHINSSNTTSHIHDSEYDLWVGFSYTPPFVSDLRCHSLIRISFRIKSSLRHPFSRRVPLSWTAARVPQVVFTTMS
ncbi:hypothetical protein GDO81_027557 [Engystomops pustulosus]|uniref:Uncharacterized protein n=1 Tax=Engystomops pustulosus TaxID=76066 RepID=A0AAV6YFQ3_ENGPU|nr:hypothetical protein GDO81_027557 [Engystomops pustulosus]